jgi:hypothetical protein
MALLQDKLWVSLTVAVASSAYTIAHSHLTFVDGVTIGHVTLKNLRLSRAGHALSIDRLVVTYFKASSVDVAQPATTTNVL